MTWSRAQRQRIRQIVRGRSQERLFILEGRKAVSDALAANAVAELWLRADLEPDVQQDMRDAADDAGIFVGEGALSDFDTTTGTVTSQGVIALVRDPAQPVADVLASDAPWILWLDGVQDPGNVGALMRVAAGFGAAVLVSRGSAHPCGAKALRASAGLALRVPFALDDAERIAEATQTSGRTVWMLESGGVDVFDAQPPTGPAVLIAGSEGRGASAEARAIASQEVSIAMASGVESLNVAVAVGIATAVLTRNATQGTPSA